MSDLIRTGPRVPLTPETTERHRAGLAARMAEGPLAQIQEGQVLEQFAPTELAMLIEQAAHQGYETIQIRMSREDAVTFASYLRRASLAGV